MLQGFEDEDVEVTSIDVPKLDVKEAFERYDVEAAARLERLTVRSAGDVVRAEAGERIRLRAVLQARAHGRDEERRPLPARPRKREAQRLHRGARAAVRGVFEDPCFLFPEECGEDTTQTFDQLLKAFKNQPPGDALVARLWLRAIRRDRAPQAVAQQDAVVSRRRGDRLPPREVARA